MRYKADIASVSVVLGTFALGLFPFIVPLPMWAFLIYIPVLLYGRSYCPYAQHNHGHLPVFYSPILNSIYNVFLTQTTGYPTALWELHHNRGHHRNFLTPEQDVARLIDLKTGKVVNRWWYALRGNLTIHRDSFKIGIAEKRANKKSLLTKLNTEIAVQTIITLGLFMWHPVLTLVCFVIPSFFTAWFIWWESYQHHLHVEGETIYDASVTITGKFFNLTTFNIGHHTAHHEKPTLHWSLLPQRTAAIRAKIPEQYVRPSRSKKWMKQNQQDSMSA
ncbi:MAG: fatty acid desaturase [Xanthomonadaceae bacterium]|nr:fatty acid desaturase [Xanthomonadaceae bacterium]